MVRFNLNMFAEKLEKANMYQKGMSLRNSVDKLKELLKDYSNEKPLIIKSKDGEEARLGRSSIGKLVSNAAVQKSMDNGFTREQHYAAASDIDDLFKNSVKVSSRPDKSGDKNITIHRFAAPLFGNKAAYITVKESVQHGKRIYSAELMEIKKLGGILEEARDKSPTHFPTPSSKTIGIQPSLSINIQKI
jgi:hypothetical protein